MPVDDFERQIDLVEGVELASSHLGENMIGERARTEGVDKIEGL